MKKSNLDLRKILVIVKIRFQGVPGYILIGSWREYILSNLKDLFQNNELHTLGPHIRNPKEVAFLIGVDSSESPNNLDHLFSRISSEWTEFLTEQQKWELTWDISVYDFSLRTSQLYGEGKRVNEVHSDRPIAGQANQDSLASVERFLLTSKSTKSTLKPWLVSVTH